MATLRLDISYDGGGFSGWATQPGLRTVEGELSTALETVLRRPVELTVAGRTDAGVHAWGQVASCRLAGEVPPRLARGLNGVLPDDVAVHAAVAAPEGFDARRDARSRTYCYRVLAAPTPNPFERGRALWHSQPVELEVLEACAATLLGTHDFTAFTPTETDHVRFERDVLRAEWSVASPSGGGGRLLELWIEADSFMRNMVRVLVGTMLEVAGGRRSGEEFAALLDGAPRSAAGATAKPHGLYLASVRY